MTKFQHGTIFTIQVMGCQVHTIGKAIRPLFTDPVTNLEFSTRVGTIAHQQKVLKKARVV